MVVPDFLGQEMVIKSILDRIMLCVLTMVQVKTMTWFASTPVFVTKGSLTNIHLASIRVWLMKTRAN